MLDYGSRGRIGVLLPSVNRAAEPQLRAMLPHDVAIAVTRLRLLNTSEEGLASMTRDIEPASRMLADAGVDLIVFHCTAVSTYSIELEASVVERIHSAAGLLATATSQALVDSLRALRAQRLVMLSPYTDAVNERESAFFEARGFEIIGCAGLGCRTGPEMMAVSPEQWRGFALMHANPKADAYVLSCTTARTAEVIQPLEAELGRPVVTSNTAVAWYCMRQLAVSPGLDGFGQLLTRLPGFGR